MRWVLLLIVTVFSVNTYASICQALSDKDLSETQIGVMYNAFQEGKKKDMSYSLAAIAWKESSAGKYLINLQDPSAGVFHTTIINALSYIKWKDTPFNRNRLAQLLIQDFQLSAEFAMLNLQFWKDQYGEDWKLIWRRYNGGYSDSKASRKYAEDIAGKVKTISQCGWR